MRGGFFRFSSVMRKTTNALVHNFAELISLAPWPQSTRALKLYFMLILIFQINHQSRHILSSRIFPKIETTVVKH